MNGLVLSGGGGKGAYQIGVWKALRKIHYKIDIVTGTSVGCLNALLITQNYKFLAPFIWSRIDFSEIFQDDVKKEQTTMEIIEMYGKNILKNKGMSTDNLQKKLDKIVNYRKFYKSKIDFGLVTVNLSSFKPVILTKNEIPKDKLKDYLMASATCYPAFKMKDIDGDKYIDGGYYDVLPINLAVKMGATKIVAVDLKSFGIKKKVKNNDIPITYIIPRNNIGYSLLFNRNVNRINMKYGYNDTLKEFGKLEGNKFTFKKNFVKHINHQLIKNNILCFYNLKDIEKNILLNKKLKRFINDIPDTKLYIKILENIGYSYNMPDYNIYSIRKFNKLVTNEITKQETIKKLKINPSKKDVITFMYNNMLNHNTNKIKKISLIYSSEFIAAIYLYTITRGEYNAI